MLGSCSLPCLLLILCLPIQALADLSFDGRNRFVMQAKRMSITLVNEGKEAALAQVSLDWGEDGRQSDVLPLAVSKPLLRIEAGSRSTFEVLYQGQGLPTDRETYLLLSVLDVPPSPKVPNAMQVALRHRLKLFYRPPSLKITLDDAMTTLEWTLPDGAGGPPKAHNPSPLYLTFSNLEILDAKGQRCGEPLEHLMLAPFSEQRLEMKDCRPASLRYDIVSDAGNFRPQGVTLDPGSKARAVPR
ncbi:molecular chaperone [Pseudomonas paraeruginosa]|uniref:fimbrial biogenesis chaperone n=1 Tax=Pseudomonas paraeruginosa TaxID=2994495 RepID=UPI00374862CE